MRIAGLLLLTLCAALLVRAELTPAEQRLTDAVTPQTLRGHVSFLASDLLEGRDTPSRGLDIAAEYIAAEFRRIGLEPAGDNGYFQMALFKTAPVKNVAAILRGSDAKAKEDFVLVSCHYDHVGVQGTGAGDHIYNGANDDASGTASMLAVAEALAVLPQRPKRSVLFIAYFGEEKGLVGSRFYVKHPLVPLVKTLVEVNLEHMGRTDETEGPSIKRLSVTGFSFSDLTDWLTAAGKDTGVTIFNNKKNSDPFYGRSDNFSLAEAGVPAHTLAAAYIFPDYHQPGDEWQKLDYDNMAAVTRTVAVTVNRLLNSSKRIRWNENSPKTEKFVEAAEALAGAH